MGCHVDPVRSAVSSGLTHNMTMCTELLHVVVGRGATGDSDDVKLQGAQGGVISSPERIGQLEEGMGRGNR